MSNVLLTFQRFQDPVLANELLEKLNGFGVTGTVEISKSLLDPVLAGPSGEPEYFVKIASGDFIKAHQHLEAFYRASINELEPDYYLFDFSNEELQEIIKTPEEWGPLDFQLAIKLLKERGIAVPEANSSVLSKENLARIAKKSNGKSLKTISIVFIAYIILSLLAQSITHRYNFPFSTILVTLIGANLAWSRKTLPDGSQVWHFEDKDRADGKAIFYSGLFLLFIAFIYMLMFMAHYSFDPFDVTFW